MQLAVPFVAVWCCMLLYSVEVGFFCIRRNVNPDVSKAAGPKSKDQKGTSVLAGIVWYGIVGTALVNK